MSEREELAVIIGSVSPTGHVYSKGNDACPAAADAVLASPWLRAHDDRIRAEAWREGMRAAASDVGIVYDIGLEPPNPYAAALRAAAGTPTHHTTEEDADE